jgi:hypothetical protein
MDKYKPYSGYKVGEVVELLVPYKSDRTIVSKGVHFKIISFPPCVTPSKTDRFVYGKTATGSPVRVFIEDIKPVKNERFIRKQKTSLY